MKIIDSTIIVALISMAGTIIGSMIGVMKSIDKTLYRIEQLEKKLKLTIILLNEWQLLNKKKNPMNNESIDWSVKNMINWKIRFKNPVFYIQLIVSIISSIFAYMGITASEITSWYKLFEIIRQAFSNPYIIFIMVISIYNFLIDPTTKGISDSKKAMTYDEPNI